MQVVTINLQQRIQKGIYLAVGRPFHLQSNLEMMTLHGGKYAERENGNSGAIRENRCSARFTSAINTTTKLHSPIPYNHCCGTSAIKQCIKEIIIAADYIQWGYK